MLLGHDFCYLKGGFSEVTFSKIKYYESLKITLMCYDLVINDILICDDVKLGNYFTSELAVSIWVNL